MHPSIEQLLAHLDQVEDLHVIDHLDQCTACQAELQSILRTRDQLRALPQVDAPAASWSKIRTSFEAPERAPRRRSLLVTAIAASAAGLAFVLMMQPPSEPPQERAAEPSAPSVRADHSLAGLIEQSSELDKLLQGLPNRPSVERVAMAATLDSIEERIQWLDFQLSYAAAEQLDETQTETLWRERVELMDSLVKVRYAQSSRVSF